MNAFFDRLGLTPSERRLSIMFLIVLFTMLNMWFVWPRFGDWEEVQIAIQTTENQVLRRKMEIVKIPDLEARLLEIQSAIGTNAVIQDSRAQRNMFQRTIDTLAGKTGVTITQGGAVTELGGTGGRTNQFFTELSRNVTLIAREQELVDFLYELGISDARIRVSDLLLSQSASDKTALQARMTLVASYKKETAEPVDTPAALLTSTDTEP